MIISNDLKYLFIANPKTGTNTARNVLRPYGYYISDAHSSSPSQHVTVDECIELLSRQKPEFNPSQLEKIYVFWRDPIKRFTSAYNFVKQSISGPGLNFLVRTRPNILINNNTDISPENLLLDRINSPSKKYEDPIAQILTKQSKWIKPSTITQVLNFDDYENNLRIVAAAFGADISTLEIPSLNESSDTGLEITSSLEAMIREYYAEDYALI
jgi:hypothetical protein